MHLTEKDLVGAGVQGHSPGYSKCEIPVNKFSFSSNARISYIYSFNNSF
jgi:hypothetical protein